jgi:hypothetical protein
MKCSGCGKNMPAERYELLGVRTCIKCTPPRSKPYGIMEYSHKNTAQLVLCDTFEEFHALKKPANQRR